MYTKQETNKKTKKNLAKLFFLMKIRFLCRSVLDFKSKIFSNIFFISFIHSFIYSVDAVDFITRNLRMNWLGLFKILFRLERFNEISKLCTYKAIIYDLWINKQHKKKKEKKLFPFFFFFNYNVTGVTLISIIR